MRQRKKCDIDSLVTEYKAGRPIAELEKMFGLEASTIYRRLNEAGCALKTMKQREGEVGCPCFRAVVLSSVKCEAGEAWNHMSLNFDNVAESQAYCKRLCLSQNYTQCPFFATFEVTDENRLGSD